MQRVAFIWIFQVALLTCLFTLPYEVLGQENLLDVEGGIKISNVNSSSPDPGIIRWTGTDVEVYDGSIWVSLTASNEKLKDIDNNIYDIVTIGTQTWMAENLRTTRYNDGTFIPQVTDDLSWSNLSTPAYTWYNNDNSPSHLGALYNYYTAADTNSRNVCPTGWHVPSNSELNTLLSYLGGNSIAGGKLRETGLANWRDPNTGATNDSGFRALAGGNRRLDGSFASLGFYGRWWTSTESSETFALSLVIGHSQITGNNSNIIKGSGLSIRCIKD